MRDVLLYFNCVGRDLQLLIAHVLVMGLLRVRTGTWSWWNPWCCPPKRKLPSMRCCWESGRGSFWSSASPLEHNFSTQMSPSDLLSCSRMEAPGHDLINSTTQVISPLWIRLSFPDDIDEIATLYNSTLVDVINSFLSNIIPHPYRYKEPWFDVECRREKRHLTRLRRVMTDQELKTVHV